MTGIKDKVAIIGMGVTKTGELWDQSTEDLLVTATTEALDDAGIAMSDVQAGFLGVQYSIVAPTILSGAMKTGHMPVTQVLNLCATGGDVLRVAAMSVASGMYDIVIAAGAEKLKDEGGTGIPGAQLLRGSDAVRGGLSPGQLAIRYAHHYGFTQQEIKRYLALIAVKNHQNGSLNPKAAFQKPVTLEQVLNAPIMSWPLGLYDYCANVDGAAAIIICNADIAQHFRDDYVLIKASVLATSDTTMDLTSSFDAVHLPENEYASRIAYEEVGIKDPVAELSMAQIHDAFTIVELLNYEDLGFIPRGTAPKHIEEGFFGPEGALPVNIDGGLKCFGHPIGATGLKMLYEPYLQLRGKAGPRQLKNPTLALAQNQGGGNASCSVVTILGTRD